MNESMTTFAWIFMLASMGGVTFLMVYTWARILREGKQLSAGSGVTAVEPGVEPGEEPPHPRG